MEKMWRNQRQLKAICVLLILAMTLGLLPGAAWAKGNELAGSGTADAPYLLANAEDLKAFRDLVNAEDSSSLCARLTADIDLGNEEWEPFNSKSGYVTTAYAGVFDGDGHTIRGLSINATTANQGLFSVINGATVKNLNVKGNVTSTKGYVGGIVGKIQQGNVENCSFSGTVTTDVTGSNGYVGGIAGYAGNTATKTQTASISGCVNTDRITGGVAGGIVGYAVYTEIESCYNTGAINGTSRAGGIAGQLQNNCTATHCYNIGTVSGSTTAGGICDFLYSSSKLSDCYSKDVISGAGGGTVEDCGALGDASALLGNLGGAFAADSNNINGGLPILSWQAAGGNLPPAPSTTASAITIVSPQGSTLWAQAGDNHLTELTLKAECRNMDEETPKLAWSIDEETAATGQTAENDQTAYKVTANQGGMATITVAAVYQGNIYTDQYTITVIPYFTTAGIKNIEDAYSDNIAVGQTVKAVQYVQGGGVFDGAAYPGLELKYRWYRGTEPVTAAAAEDTYLISDEFGEWDRLGVEISCNGQVIHDYRDQQATVRSADYGVLYPIANDEAFFTGLRDVKTDNVTLPKEHTVNGVTAEIVWGKLEGSDFTAYSDGELQALLVRPQEGTKEVPLAAQFTYKDAFINRTVTFTLWSDEELGKEPVQPEVSLQEAVTALGADYRLYPVWGQDSNVNELLQAALAAKGCADVQVTVEQVEEIYGGAGIGEDGTITYFYADPNTPPAIRMGSYKVTFTLSKGAETLEYEDVPVILYWDVSKVKEVMTAEILDNVGIDTTVPVTKDFALPKVVDDKKWTLISWNSSDDAVIAISEENQGTADTLFAPYVAKVKQGDTDKTVMLTATFTFQFTNDVTGQEQPIAMIKVFNINVPALDGTEQERIQRELQEKLEQGFAAKGLTDAVTGENLVAENDIYTVDNNIQFPTTRDFGVDGKMYPVRITSSNEAVLKAPDVNNAARVEVYRPSVGERDAEAVVTVTMRDKNTNITASKEFSIRIKALTQTEIDAELALMEKVKANYFEGIKGENATKDNVRTDLIPFQEVYERDGQLVWVRDSKERVGYGIVPTPIEGWEEWELWRLFKSSNANVISHENLLVDRQKEAKAVTITSYLSSETLGRYGQLYREHPEQYPQYAQLADLYYQEVTTDTVAQPAQRQARMAKAASNTMIVRGTRDPESAVPVEEKLKVAFALTGLDGETWILTTFSDLEENLTVYDLFEQALTEQGYTWERQKGTYVVSITAPDGETLSELDFGKRSGWMYRVNGVLQDVYMGACPLHNGDKVQVFYTKDASADDPNWDWPFEDSTGATAGGGTTNTAVNNKVEALQIVQNEEKGTYTITLPTGEQKESQLVTFPAGKAGQLVVIVYPDGTEKVVKKAVTENGQTKLLLDTNATVKLVDYANNYSDVADGAWYNSAVDFVTGRKLFSGVSDTAFAPDVVFSRAMAATVLYRLAEPDAEALDNPFHDVAKDAWYAQSVAWAANVGVVGGYGNETFGPEDSVTREQFVAMLYRFAKSENSNLENHGSLQQFADEDTVSDWAKETMTWAVDAGIINGLSDKTLNPSGTTTRAQAAVMLQRFVEFMVQ